MSLKPSLIFLLLPLLQPLTGLANGSRLPSQGDAAVARGYAFTATADDLSAIYYNPAGLGLQKSAAFDAGAYILRPAVDYQAAGGTSLGETRKTFTLPYAYAALPLGPVVVGVGAYAPFGLSTEWDPRTSTFSTLATRNSLVYRRTALTVAYALTPQLLLGGSVEFDQLHADLNRALGYIPHGGDGLNFTGRASGTTWNAGLLFQPSPEHSFGCTYQAGNDLTVNGTTSYQPAGFAESSSVKWPFPENIAFGYSFRPTPGWNWEVGYDWTHWSRLGTLTLQRAVSGPLPLVFGWKNSGYYEAGVTRELVDGWKVSGGLCYSENSIPDATLSPSLPDYSKWLWNAGVGRRIGHWNLSCVLQYSPVTTRTVTGSLRSPAGETADGTYRGKMTAVGGQLGYRW